MATMASRLSSWGLIGRLLTLTDELYVTMTLDHREEPFQMEAEHQLFYATKKDDSGFEKSS